MFLELIGTIFAGIACAGIAMILNIISGRRLPRWTMPVAAGLGMIAMTISSEYSWYGRTVDTLPEGMEIVQEVESRALYRPWTYAVPFVDRFAAIDTISVRKNENVPEQRLVDLYFFGRWAPRSMVPVAVNCDNFSRANLADGVEFSEDGRVVGASWIDAPTDDPLIKATCGV